MKTLIMGGSGLIGHSFIGLLSREEHHIWLLSRQPEKIKMPENVQIVKWDGKTTQGWQNLVNEVDVIVNLAGENIGSRPWTEKRKEQILTSRVMSSRTIVNAIAGSKKKPSVLLQASAVGYYGTSTNTYLDENSAPGNDFLSSICLDWENESHKVEEYNVRRIVMRTGIVLSPQGGVLERIILPTRFYLGGPLGSGIQWWSWIHIEDVVNAMKFLIQNPSASGAVNLTSPNPVRMIDFGKTLAQIIRKPFWFPVPAILLQMILGEMSTMILDGQAVLPKKLLDLGYTFKFPDLAPALKDILSK